MVESWTVIYGLTLAAVLCWTAAFSSQTTSDAFRATVLIVALWGASNLIAADLMGRPGYASLNIIFDLMAIFYFYWSDYIRPRNWKLTIIALHGCQIVCWFAFIVTGMQHFHCFGWAINILFCLILVCLISPGLKVLNNFLFPTPNMRCNRKTLGVMWISILAGIRFWRR